MNLLTKLVIILSLFNIAPAKSAHEPLKTMIRTVYPVEIKQVDELIGYILEGTEYKLYRGAKAPYDAEYILKKKIPYQRKTLLMTRMNALLMAVGDKHSIIVDEHLKLISVTRDPI